MATLTHADSRRMYSWWWDSHISPKNSKWLQENLTDMDAKVKQMIKLLEADADSFARRAEMYYKRRPELLKLVEEFYRAYRALAERYDHATGVIRQAHRTMAEVFPNQVPLVLGDDSPAGSAAAADSRTPEMASVRAFLDPEEMQNGALGRNGAFTDESDSGSSRKGLKQLNDLFGSGGVNHMKLGEGRARKGLNFLGLEEKERVPSRGSDDLKARVPSESERVSKAEMEIVTLKNALAKLEAEKEAGLIQYQQSLQRLSNLESEVSRAREDSEGLKKQAGKAETEVQTLKEALARLEAEREANLLQYHQCLDKISNLEKSVLRAETDASKAEIEAESLKQNLARVEAEKETAVVKYEQSMKMVSDLESKLLRAEEDAGRIHEQADKAESEVENLKQALAKLTEEKEALGLKYQQCLETISDLELKLARAEEEVKRLNDQLDDGVVKLKGAEAKCLLLEESNQTLQSELEAMLEKMGSQSQELTEKQKELGRLWTCIQEERLRFVEAETAFQTLQHLHSQSQEELRSLATELQNRAQILQDMETRNCCLQDEVEKAKEKSKGLNELNLSSAMSIKNLQDDILVLRGTIGKLEAEVELRVDQRNALQQEIYCLKEELNELNKKHLTMVEQVESVCLNPENFGLSVRKLQDENSELKDICERDRNEKVELLEKLMIMEKLLEKNSLLENSLSDMNVELEAARERVKALEEAFHNLLGEKSSVVSENGALLSHLQTATENLEKLTEKNNFLENSLSDAHTELETLREKSQSLEESCLLLKTEKSGLVTERENLVHQLDIAQRGLQDLGERHAALELKCFSLEKERDSTIQKVEELWASLDFEKQEHANFVQQSETRLVSMESQIRSLREEGQCRNKEYEEELDKSLNSQIEIFILQKYVQDLKEKNMSLLFECQKLLEASDVSEKLIFKLEHENLDQQEQVKSLSDQIKAVRVGIYQVAKALEIDADHGCEGKIEYNQKLLNQVLGRLKERHNSIFKALDENQQLVVEKLVLVALLRQLERKAEDLAMQKNTLDKEFRNQSEQFLLLQSKVEKLVETNEELSLKLVEGDHKQEGVKTAMGNLQMLLLDLQGVYQSLQEQNKKLFDEKKSLMKKVLDLEEEKHLLEEENCILFSESVSHSNLSEIFKDVIREKMVEINVLNENLQKLSCVNNELEEEVRIIEGQLENVEVENSDLKLSLERSENELISTKSINDQLNSEIENAKDMMSQKEKELLVAEQMLLTVQNERTELYKTVEELECKYHEVKLMQEYQQEKLLKLSEDNDLHIKEKEHLRGSNLKMEAELKETKQMEECLNNELEKTKIDVELWETQASKFFNELQMSSVCEALLEEKTHELMEACENLENSSNSKDKEVEKLKERVSTLEGENGGIKAQLADSIMTIISLRDSVKSLERHTLSHKIDSGGAKDAVAVNDLCAESCQSTSGDQMAKELDDYSDLQDLQTRLKAIEKAVMEKETLAELENSATNSKLVAAMRQIEELKNGRSSRQLNPRTSRDINRRHEQQKPTPEIYEEGDEVMKDIMLDQVSECSSYGISRRETVEADDQMLELWETTDHSSSIDLRVGKPQKVATLPTDFHQMEAVKQQKGNNLTIESLVEKELGVDTLEISKRLSESRKEGSKKKVLERLDSDAQKLTNLQITVQDLKRKVESSEKGIKGKGLEYDTVKEQLEEAEEAILKLFDVNHKLITNVKELSSSSFEGRSAIGSDDSRGVRRRRITEQARRAYEKIGRLQLEVQKIQFLLLKLDDEKESRAKTRFTGRNTRVLLRDYLYGGRRPGQKRKKAHFCSCVQPPTRGE